MLSPPANSLMQRQTSESLPKESLLLNWSFLKLSSINGPVTSPISWDVKDWPPNGAPSEDIEFMAFTKSGGGDAPFAAAPPILKVQVLLFLSFETLTELLPSYPRAALLSTAEQLYE